MSNIQPEGEELRKAVKWISDERQYGADKTLIKLIEEGRCQQVGDAFTK